LVENFFYQYRIYPSFCRFNPAWFISELYFQLFSSSLWPGVGFLFPHLRFFLQESFLGEGKYLFLNCLGGG